MRMGFGDVWRCLEILTRIVYRSNAFCAFCAFCVCVACGPGLGGKRWKSEGQDKLNSKPNHMNHIWYVCVKACPVDPSSLAAQHPQSIVFFPVFIHASFALHSRGCSVWGQVRAGWSCAGACLSLTIDPFRFHFFVTNVNNMLMSECIWTILKSSEFMIFTYHSYIIHWIFCPFLSTLAGGGSRRWTPTTSSRGLPWSALKRCGGRRKMENPRNLRIKSCVQGPNFLA